MKREYSRKEIANVSIPRIATAFRIGVKLLTTYSCLVSQFNKENSKKISIINLMRPILPAIIQLNKAPRSKNQA